MVLNANINNAGVLSALQSQYGSVDFNRWQSLRYQFYSYVQYPIAGANTFTFFGSALGSSGTTPQLTNMPKAGSFGNQHFLLKAIRCEYYIKTTNYQGWDGTEASSIVPDLLWGFASAGYMEFDINSMMQFQLPRPFLYAPPARGERDLMTSGLDTLTLTEGTPNLLATYRTGPPSASLNSSENGLFLVDPNILITSDENFSCVINYPTGAVALGATGIVNDTTNPFYIGVSLDGILFRPGAQ